MNLKRSPFSILDKEKREIDYIKGVYRKKIQSEIDSYRDTEDEEMRDAIKAQDVLMLDSISIQLIFIDSYVNNLAINQLETFLINAIRRFSYEYVYCCYCFAYQKRDQTKESEINYENKNPKRSLYSKSQCNYFINTFTSMSLDTSSTKILINNLIK